VETYRVWRNARARAGLTPSGVSPRFLPLTPACHLLRRVARRCWQRFARAPSDPVRGRFVTAPARPPLLGATPRGRSARARAAGQFTSAGLRIASPPTGFPAGPVHSGFRVVCYFGRQPLQSSKRPLWERQVQLFEPVVEGYVVSVFVEATLASHYPRPRGLELLHLPPADGAPAQGVAPERNVHPVPVGQVLRDFPH